MTPDLIFLYAMAKTTREFHLTLLRNCVPACVLVSGDRVTTTWPADIKAKIDACERVQAAWVRVAQAIASFDDAGIAAAGAEMRREFDRSFGSVLGVDL